ncbi:MAG TPA: Gfo/Idh/MocA family oxidoreductase, partial [Saprospiraceae bacterium]|nr:Gfo/Idh/MocA family oxidoreductase [Saprospiraceae bacterium]
MISFVIIGFGNIGERHALHISAHEDAYLRGCYDIKKERRDLFHIQYPDAIVYQSLEEALKDETVDIVSICTPNHTHTEIVLASLQAGKHVLVEKPMAIKKLDCENMIHMALKTGKNLFVVK